LTELTGEIATRASSEIRNSNYVMVVTQSSKILLHNWQDTSIENRIINTGYETGTLTTVTEFLEWRLLLTAGGDRNYIQVFTLPERPCDDPVAETCDVLEPKTTLSCKENSRISLDSGVAECICTEGKLQSLFGTISNLLPRLLSRRSHKIVRKM
jgi:hypothetical protein